MGKKQRIRKAQSMKQLNTPIADDNRRRRRFTYSKLKYRIDHCIEVLCRLSLLCHDPKTEMLNLLTKSSLLIDDTTFRFTYSKLEYRIDHCIEVPCRSRLPWYWSKTEMLNLCTKLRFLKDHNSDIEDSDLYAELLFLQFNCLMTENRGLKDDIILQKVELIYFPWEQLKDINAWRSTYESSNGRRLRLRLLILSIPSLKFLLPHLFDLLSLLVFVPFSFVYMMKECENMILKVLSKKIQWKGLEPDDHIEKWRYAYFQACHQTTLSKKIRSEGLEPGDHTYTWRRAYSYAHHGIYVGNGMVIHLTRGAGHILLSSSRSHPSDNPRGQISGDQLTCDRVVSSSLDSFLFGGDLYIFEYGVDLISFLSKTRGGTCTLAWSDPPEVVVHRATTLLKNGFGVYNLSGNNCEDFAIYCKTGLLVDNSNCLRRSIGRSGQAASSLAAILVFISSLFRWSTASSLWMAIVGCLIYCIFRFVLDIGIRRNVRKVEVEELGAALDRFGRFSFRRTSLDDLKPYLVPMIYLFLGILLCEIYWADAIILYGMFM